MKPQASRLAALTIALFAYFAACTLTPAFGQGVTGQTQVQVQNKQGGGSGFAAGDVVRSNGTTGQFVKAQADTAAHSSGPLLVMTTAAADNGYGYAVQMPAWVQHDSAPTVGAVSWLSASAAGKASTTAPANSGTNQHRALGVVAKVSGNLAFVVGSIENVPAAASATSSPVTYSTGLTLDGSANLTSDAIAGKAGGVTITGGTAASDPLTMRSTSHATKGKTTIGVAGSDVTVDEVNHRLGIGTSSPSAGLHLVGTLRYDNPGASGILFNNNGGAVGLAVANTDFPHPSATYVTKTATNAPSGAFALGSLATGLLKNTTTTGTPTIAVANTDFAHPSATYLTETATSAPTNAFALGSLATGILKNTTTTGVPSIAVANTDYPHPSATYITQTTTNAPSGAQALASLSSGVAHVTTSTGAVSSFAVTSTRIPYGSGSGGAITDSSSLAWDNTNKIFSLGPSSGVSNLNVGATIVDGTAGHLSGLFLAQSSSIGARLYYTANAAANTRRLDFDATGYGFQAFFDFSKLSLNVQSGSDTVLGSTGNVVAATSARATNATDGFLYVPTCAGTPTGTPTTQTGTVPIIFDTTGGKLWIYTGGSWKGGTTPGAFN